MEIYAHITETNTYKNEIKHFKKNYLQEKYNRKQVVKRTVPSRIVSVPIHGVICYASTLNNKSPHGFSNGFIALEITW